LVFGATCWHSCSDSILHSKSAWPFACLFYIWYLLVIRHIQSFLDPWKVFFWYTRGHIPDKHIEDPRQNFLRTVYLSYKPFFIFELHSVEIYKTRSYVNRFWCFFCNSRTSTFILGLQCKCTLVFNVAYPFFSVLCTLFLTVCTLSFLHKPEKISSPPPPQTFVWI
jgi:hypothetical protein